MSTQTSNLGLSKPDISDTPGVTIPQLASNFDKIDASLADMAIQAPASTGKDDTTNLQNAINNAIANNVPLKLKSKSTYITNTLTIPAQLVLLGSDATLKPVSDGITILEANFSSNNSFEIYDLILDMTSFNNVVGLDCNHAVEAVVRRFKTIGGSYAMMFQNSSNNHLDQLKLNNYGISGIYIQGDGGAEFEISNVYGPGLTTATALLEIYRTTANDVGAYYLYNVLGFYAKHSIYAHSSVTSGGSTVVVNLTGGGGDSTQQEALCFQNVNNIRVNNAWIATGSGASYQSVKLDNVIQAYFSNSYVPDGFTFATLVKDFGSLNLAISNNIAFNISGTPTLQNIKFDNMDAPAGLTNDANQLINGVTLSTSTTGRSVYLSPTTKTGGFTFINAAATANQKTLRVDNDNSLTILDAAYANELFKFYDDGTLKAGVVGLKGGNFIISGAGTPEGIVSAVVGSLYLRTDGGTSTTLYVKESGTGNTGWTAK